MPKAHLAAMDPDPLDVIVEDPDPAARSKAHMALGLRAKAREDIDQAIWHLREALDLDPTDETTREELRNLGQVPDQAPPPEQGSWFGRLFPVFRRRHG